MIHIRPATPGDVSLILAFVRELAEYEREPHAVTITEEELLRDGFGPDRYYESLIAESDGAPAAFALFFPVYSTWQGRSLHLEDLFVRPHFAAKESANRFSAALPPSPSSAAARASNGTCSIGTSPPSTSISASTPPCSATGVACESPVRPSAHSPQNAREMRIAEVRQVAIQSSRL